MVAVLLAATSSAAISSAAETTAHEQPWRLDSETRGVKIYSRLRPGSTLKEFKATDIIDAPTRVVHNVLNDVEGYPHFMPYVAECRILKRDGNSIYAYQRISPKIVSDRDYTLHIEEKSHPTANGTVYSKQWRQTNELGPAERKGILRVKVCDGSWLLEPEANDKTRATYTVYTDTGGSLPAFIANLAGGIGIRKIFAAVRTQVKDPKYRSYRDFLEGGR
jgi:hypothetical protein